jgi:hypothetical protein
VPPISASSWQHGSIDIKIRCGDSNGAPVASVAAIGRVVCERRSAGAARATEDGPVRCHRDVLGEHLDVASVGAVAAVGHEAGKGTTTWTIVAPHLTSVLDAEFRRVEDQRSGAGRGKGPPDDDGVRHDRFVDEAPLVLLDEHVGSRLGGRAGKTRSVHGRKQARADDNDETMSHMRAGTPGMLQPSSTRR